MNNWPTYVINMELKKVLRNRFNFILLTWVTHFTKVLLMIVKCLVWNKPIWVRHFIGHVWGCACETWNVLQELVDKPDDISDPKRIPSSPEPYFSLILQKQVSSIPRGYNL